MLAAAPSRHILVLVDRDWTHPDAGGTGTNLWAQVSCWLRDGHRVTVVASTYDGAAPLERDGALTVHRTGSRITLFPRAIWKLIRSDLRDVDMVLEVINGITFLTPLWLGVPHVALVHHVHRRHFVKELGAWAAPLAVALETIPLATLYRRTPFLTVSHTIAEEIARHGIARSSITVNHNGVDTETLRPGARSERPTILCLGRLKRYKRVELLLDALEQIPHAVLEVAGEGDHRPALEAQVRERGLGDRVRLHGFVDEERKRALLQRAWVHATASAAEGWCLAVSEAGACGTPSVALAVGGLRDSIVHDQTGLLADTPQELTHSLSRILDSADLRRRLGRGAFEHAQCLTWENTAARTLAALEAERSRWAGERVPATMPPAADFADAVPRRRFSRSPAPAPAEEPARSS